MPIAIGRGIIEVQARFKQIFNLPDAFPADGSQFDRLFEEGDEFRIGALSCRVIATPGHTSDSNSFLISDAVFVGDTLFAPDFGTARCDFPGGNAGVLYDSIQKLYELPEEGELVWRLDDAELRAELERLDAVIAAIVAALVLGFMARFDLPVRLFPDTDPPTVTVITPLAGMAAPDVDSDLTRLLEEEFASLDGVTRISSNSQVGLSVVTVEFDYQTSSALAAVDVQNAIGRIRHELPPEIDEPQVLEFSTADKPIVTLALHSEVLPIEQVRELADNAVRERLERVPGVAVVDVFGGHKLELHAAVDRDRLAAAGLDTGRVMAALDDWNLSAAAVAVATRLRPILMTALSTIAGMLPLALEMAVGAERFSPIATVIIGGILTATMLTLVIVPLLFVLLERLRRGRDPLPGSAA